MAQHINAGEFANEEKAQLLFQMGSEFYDEAQRASGKADPLPFVFMVDPSGAMFLFSRWERHTREIFKRATKQPLPKHITDIFEQE